MGLGNGNAKQGDRGSNHNFEHRQLLTLGSIAAFVGGGATEATLQLVLAAIQNGSEFEARLVEDSDAPAVTWLEVRTWNTSLGTWNPPVYYPPGSNTPGAPVLPVVYINNSSVLATIASNTADNATETTLALINAKLASLGQTNNAGSMPVTLSTEQEAMIDGIEALLTTIDADTSNLDVALSTVATEATLLIIDTVLDGIATDIGLIEGYLAPSVRTSGCTRITTVTAGNVAAGARSASFYNAHPTENCQIGGCVLKPGEVVSFSAGGQGDTLAQINWTTLVAADLLITTVV
jgi:hypothetical protein